MPRTDFRRIAPMPGDGDPLDRVAEYVGGVHRQPSSLTPDERRAVALWLRACDEWRDGGAVDPPPEPPRCLFGRPPLRVPSCARRWPRRRPMARWVALGALVSAPVLGGCEPAGDATIKYPAVDMADAGPDGSTDE